MSKPTFPVHPVLLVDDDKDLLRNYVFALRADGITNVITCNDGTDVAGLMKELRDSYDRVIIDSPPILPVSDSTVLSTHADSLVYVIKAGATTDRQVRSGLSQLQRFNARITGVVLNQSDDVRATERFSDSGYYGGYDTNPS